MEKLLKILKKQGVKNPIRIKKLIENSIKNFKLNLSDLIVFTEAASGNYIVTPIIAAKAGAKVYAITSDSSYGKATDIKKLTLDFADFCDVKDRIEVIFEKKKEYISHANIITNLGFVRPINKNFINKMNELAVVSYMREPWEYRKSDVDLEYCKSKRVPVMGLNEGDTFNYCEDLCAKLLYESGIEILKNKILVISNDKFGQTINNFLKKIGADVDLISDIKSHNIEEYDAIIVADFLNNVQIPKEISEKVVTIKIANNFKMEKTFSYLGPKPVIDLHTAGLKVGEIMARLRIEGFSYEDTMSKALENDLIRDIN